MSKSQLTLIEVPRQPGLTPRARLEVFKTAHRIFTHCTPRATGTPDRWDILLVPEGIPMTTDAIWQGIAEFCSLWSDQRILITARGELSGVRQLCLINGIPCDL